MTPEQINREIAEKVMGWEYDSLGGILDDNKHPAWIAEDSSWIREEDWDPYHRIDHAMMALEKYGDWMIEKTSNGQYYCRIGWGFTEGVWATTKEEAICLAVLGAIGGER